MEKETEAEDHSQTKNRNRFAETGSQMGAKTETYSATPETKAGDSQETCRK